MLQQTQVDRVLPKYRAFLQRFPTVLHLGRARRASVVRAWSGLGYYNRAVRLHRAARTLLRKHRGTFPTTFDALWALPGVGPYTASAIRTFAFGKRVAAVDVNHARIIRRLFFGMHAPPASVIQTAAASLLPNREASTWNQAMMDFGALVCKSVPRCHVCPVRQQCRAYPAILTRAPSRPRMAEPFVGSDRYFRGRIVHVLRSVSRAAGATQRQLWERVSAIHPILPARCRVLVAALVRDGVVCYIGRTKRAVRLA